MRSPIAIRTLPWLVPLVQGLVPGLGLVQGLVPGLGLAPELGPVRELGPVPELELGPHRRVNYSPIPPK